MSMWVCGRSELEHKKLLCHLCQICPFEEATFFRNPPYFNTSLRIVHDVYPTSSCSLVLGVGCVIIIAKEYCGDIHVIVLWYFEKLPLAFIKARDEGRDTRNIDTSLVKFSKKEYVS